MNEPICYLVITKKRILLSDMKYPHSWFLERDETSCIVLERNHDMIGQQHTDEIKKSGFVNTGKPSLEYIRRHFL